MSDGSSALRAVGRLLWRPALILLVAGALGYWMLNSGRPRHGVDEVDADLEEVSAPEDVGAAEVVAWRPRTRVDPQPGCRPQASTTCIDGDVWWVDSCAIPHRRAEDCGLRSCVDGACDDDDDPICQDTRPRCDGDIARGCSAGRSYAIDCAVEGERCVMTEDGPMCRRPTDADCRWPPAADRCEGPVLVACREGTIRRIDCRSVGGTCAPRRGGVGVHCLRPVPVPADPDCEACGCPPDPSAPELCDGRDNDGDGFIDENVDCGSLPVVAFVVSSERDGSGSSYTDDDIEAEFGRVAQAFARDDELGIGVRLEKTMRLYRPEWLALDDEGIQEVLRDATVNYLIPEFYVPVVFTEEIEVGGIPRPGLATPPNGICGGLRRVPTQQPPTGAVVIAKRRWPTTVAHEVGHYLGLCHTHTQDADVGGEFETASGDRETCVEPCTLENDGICDTPADPGPERCGVNDQCTAVCDGAYDPMPANIMGYYPTCRSLFTVGQALTMRTAWAWRKQWRRCQTGDCPCQPGARECPEGMSCRRYRSEQGGDRWQCGLDGPASPTGVCRHPGDCGQESICATRPDGQMRCVRLCRRASPTCDCTDVPADGFSICAQDIDAVG